MNHSIKQFWNSVNSNPQEAFVGFGVFFVSIMGTSVHHVASTVFALLFIASLFLIKRWGAIWKTINANERLLMYGFMLYSLSGLLAVINVQDMQEYIKDLERFMRFFMAIPIYLFIRHYRIDVIRYLRVGAILSGPFLCAITIYCYMENPLMPGRGDYHHIIFGSLAMLNIGVMLALLLTMKLGNIYKVILSVSILCALVAVLLSQSRGVWLVLPIYFLVAFYMIWKRSKLSFLISSILVIVAAGTVMKTPIGDIVERRGNQAIEEVSSFYTDNKYISSLGTRLAMWEISIEVWNRYPIVGTGPGDFDGEIRELQRNGRYVGMDVHASTHNIYMQALVTTGSIGLITMLFALFYQPIKILYVDRANNKTVALIGLNSMILFAVIGISESWVLRLPMVSVYIIYVVAIVAGIQHEKNQKKYFSDETYI